MNCLVSVARVDNSGGSCMKRRNGLSDLAMLRSVSDESENVDRVLKNPVLRPSVQLR